MLLVRVRVIELVRYPVGMFVARVTGFRRVRRRKRLI
jgi:hypothetical protein